MGGGLREDFRNCEPALRPVAHNGSAAVWHVLNDNCTISLIFEELPSVHMFIDTHAKIESGIFTPVTTHEYVSPRDKREDLFLKSQKTAL